MLRSFHNFDFLCAVNTLPTPACVCADVYEYRHVVLPPEISQLLPKGKLLSEVSGFLGLKEDSHAQLHPCSPPASSDGCV